MILDHWLSDGITISATDSSGAFLNWIGDVDSDGITRQDTGGAYSLMGRMTQIIPTDNVGIDTSYDNIPNSDKGVTCNNEDRWNGYLQPQQKFPMGTTAVTCTATDTSGNVGSASFTVTVVEQGALPVIVVTAPPQSGGGDMISVGGILTLSIYATNSTGQNAYFSVKIPADDPNYSFPALSIMVQVTVVVPISYNPAVG